MPTVQITLWDTEFSGFPNLPLSGLSDPTTLYIVYIVRVLARQRAEDVRGTEKCLQHLSSHDWSGEIKSKIRLVTGHEETVKH